MDFYSIVLLIGATQGLFIAFAILKLPKSNLKANRWLTVFLTVVSINLVIRVFYSQLIESPFPQIVVLPDFIIFIYAPAITFYLFQLSQQNSLLFKIRAIHFIPAGVHLLIMLPLLFSSPTEFFTRMDTRFYYRAFIWIEFLAIFHNLFYLLWTIFFFRKKSDTVFTNELRKPSISYIFTILFLLFSFNVVWFIGFIKTVILKEAIPGFLTYNTIWIAFSFISYLFGYYAINLPEVFKLPFKKYSGSEISNDRLLELKFDLEKLMKLDKPYLQPEFTLPDLAKTLKANPNELSQLINTEYQKNFSDFINTYRVHEFTILAEDEKNKHLTILALALEAGFNSKTTFNKAFKKLTGQTPHTYLTLRDKQLK